MVGSRLLTAVAGLAASLLVSLVVWYSFHTVFLFLFLPVVPFLLTRGGRPDESAVRSCPACGFRTRDRDFAYCPRDGSRLE